MRITGLEDMECENSGGRGIVPAKAKRALVGAGGRTLLYPTLLYNVVRNKMEAEFRWWDEIDQFILLGDVPFPKDVPRLKQLGVRGVITLNERYETLVLSSLYQAYRIDHLVIPTRDYLFAPSLVEISRAVDFIHRNASHGRITYVHCNAGRGRSTTIVLCYLVQYKHMTPATALEYVRSIMPRVLLARSQWRAVQEYSKHKVKFPAIRSLSPICSLTANEEVLITAADLEGYGISKDCNNDPNILSCGIIRTRSMTARSTPTSPLKEDEVLITEADLEGYDTCADACKDTGVSSNEMVETEPMMKKLSRLFSSFKISRIWKNRRI